MEKLSKITYDDFLKVDIRIGTVLSCQTFEKARKPAYQMSIDFGDELGVRKSSAQITHHYSPDQMVGRQILAVINFPAKQIASLMSEVLVLGVSDAAGHIVLLQPEQPVPNGQRMH